MGADSGNSITSLKWFMHGVSEQILQTVRSPEIKAMKNA